MQNTDATSTDRRSEVHTEVRVPVETVMTRVVWFVFGVIETLIAIRFVLLLLGANTQAGFVTMIYTVSGIFMAPFGAIFETQQAGGSSFEWSALVAIAVYALVAWGVAALIKTISPREHAATVERSVKDDDVRTA